MALSRYEVAWAAILVASLLGIVLYSAVVILERLVIRGYTAEQGSSMRMP